MLENSKRPPEKVAFFVYIELYVALFFFPHFLPG